MMRDDNSPIRSVAVDIVANRHDSSGHLVSQDRWCFRAAIPLEQIAAANPARMHRD